MSAATCKFKAPNQQKSELYDSLWNQFQGEAAARVWAYTKTPDFKSFFGDWDNDPSNSSTVVDKNGEPKVVNGYFEDSRSGNTLNILSVSETLTSMADARLSALTKIRDKKNRYQKTGKKEAVDNLTQLEAELTAAQDDKIALFRFIKYANSQVERAVTELDQLVIDTRDPARTSDQKRYDLRRLSRLVDYIQSFEQLGQIAEPLKGQYYDDANFGGAGKVDREFFRTYIDSTLGAIQQATEKYHKVAKPLVADFLFRYNTNQSLTKQQLESMLSTVHEDLSMTQRWADSLAESGDQVLALVDRAVSEVRNFVHQDSYAFKRQQLLPKLEALEAYQLARGIKSDDYEKLYDFMLDRDAEGKLTGKYRQPDDSAPQVYKDFFKFYHQVYTESQANIPAGYRHSMQLVPILKSSTERAFNDVGGIKSAVNAAGKLIKQSVTRNGNDTDRVEKTFDENDEEFKFVPLHFTNFIGGDKGIDPTDISLNLAQNLNRFRTMALSHDKMAGIVTELEITKDLVRDRKLHLKEGSRWVVSKTSGQPGTTSGENTNAYKKLDDFMTMHVYGEKQADEGVLNFFGVEVDKAKLYNNVAAWTAFSQLGLNVYSAVNNVTVGNLMNFIETSGGQFYGRNHWGSAVKEYTTSLPDLLKDYAGREPTSKIGIMMEQLDIFQEESPTGELLKEKGMLRRAGLNSVFFAQKAGEHATQSQLAISTFKSHRIVGGKIMGYTDWVVANNKGFTAQTKKEFELLPDAWSKLEVKDGLVTIPGVSAAELTKLSERIKGVYQRLHGNYAKRDTPALNRWGMGRLVGLFRKFLKPAWNRRWAKDTFDGEWVGEGDDRKFVPFDNFDQRLGANIGGNYTIAYNFIKNLVSNYREFNKMTAGEDWENLPEWKKQGIKRTAAEAMSFGAIALLIKGLGALEDEDDPTWLGSMGLYQMHRLSTELTAFVNPFTAMDLLRSPMASMSMVQKYGRVVEQLIPFHGYERFESGKNIGELKLGVYFGKAIPLYGQVKRVLTPEEELDWLTK